MAGNDNSDRGGNVFSVSDASCWDDGTVSASSGDGGDWDVGVLVEKGRHR